jgi:hypothetical protein
MSISSYKASLADEAFRQEFLALAQRYNRENSAMRLLAIAAQGVGQLIAFQDSSCYSPAEIMEMVSANIQAGNAFAVEGMITASGGRQ